MADPGATAFEDPGLARLGLERRAAALVESDRATRPGRLTPRQRVGALVEEGSFLELGALAASQQPTAEGPTPGDGVVTGFGTVGGTQVAVLSEDPVVLARTDGQVAKSKRRRLLKLALQQQLPVVFFADGPAGPSPTFPIGGGQLFGGLAQQPDDTDMRRRRAPLIGVIVGPAGGQAEELVLEADIVVETEGAGSDGTGVGSAGVGSAGVGSAGVGSAGAGSADVLVADDTTAARVAAALVAFAGPRSATVVGQPAGNLEGRPAIDAVAGLLADQGTFLPFVRDRGSGLVTGIGQLGGCPIVIAVTGASGQRLLVAGDVHRLRRAAAVSARLSVPLLIVQDCDGYSPEIMGDRRTAKSVADLVAELRTLPAPLVCVVAGAGHVLGTYCLGGRQLDPDYILAWPWAGIGVTDTADYRSETLAAHRQGGPWLAAGMGLVDDVMTPEETGPWLRWFVRLAEERRHLPPIAYHDRWYSRASIKGT